MTLPLITARRDGHVVELTMRNGAHANAISAQFAQELVGHLQSAVDGGARVLILRAESGVRTWCAGHDIGELPSNPSEQISWTNSLETLVSGVRSVPIPIIAAVEGGVWGGGCELVMTADLVIACRNSTFAVTPTRLGVPYAATGLNRFLAALPIHVVNEMFLTANPIDAQRAYELGFVNRIADDSEDLHRQAGEVARRIADGAPLAVRAIKATANALVDANPMSAAVSAQISQLARSAWGSADYQEGLQAFAQRRKPQFGGS